MALEIIKETPLEQAIKSNPCSRCRDILKLGKCECKVRENGSNVEGIDDCPDAVATAIALHEEQHGHYNKHGDELDEKIDDTRALSEADADEANEQRKRYELEKRTLHPSDEWAMVLQGLLLRDLLLIAIADGILSLRYRYNEKFQPGDRLQVQKVMEQFLKELEEYRLINNITNNNATVERDNMGNIIGLHISFINPRQFDNFIKMLIIKKLLAAQNNAMDPFDMVNISSRAVLPTLAMTPRLTPANRRQEEEKERDYISPFSPRLPTDTRLIRR